ncbi:MAG TPA: hypothetical protein PK522_00830, partial [Nitrosomonas sp.]|nr:hypothetical protein [Nitrosomonas sp.]
QLTATTQALDAAVEVIEAALRLQDLWLYHGKISVEHAHEANALNLMKHRFEESLEKIKALRGGE